MEGPLPMSHERIESLSSLTTPTSSEARVAQSTYPAKRVQDKRLPASEEAASSTNLNGEAPNSQESHVSSSSKGSGVAKFSSDSSNLSNLSLPDTDGASPVESNGPFSQRKDEDYVRGAQRPLTPEGNNGNNGDSQTASQSTSPMSVDSQGVKHGSKRTASGAVKPAASVYSQQSQDSRSLGTERNAKRISLQLKTRLSYAMVKVKNGWENNSIDQLETLPTHASPPATPITESPHNRPRRLSLYSETSDRYLYSPGGPMSPPSQFPGRFPQPPYPASATNWPSSASNAATVGGTPGGPTLAPAAPISSGRPSRRSIPSRAPPNLNTSRLSYHASGHPTTPTSAPARQGILRMPSGQAEKDALETLMFMSSPNNSNNTTYATSTADPSPFRSEFPPSVKRVVFES